MDPYDEFAEVYSISDLHLTVGANVDEEAVKALAAAVDALTKRAAVLGTERAALVVNGDIVDFLDIAPQRYFDPAGAPDKLDKAFGANSAFFDALARFSRAGTVVLTLGNHDLELAMPGCRAMLRKRIPGALVLAFDGAGFRCRVGSTHALFIHGNNEDAWNAVDVDRLHETAAQITAGVAFEPWVPNQGTKLVIELLNAQKVSHPFIEYVKPEKAWLFDLIAMLGYGTLSRQYAELAPRQAAASASYKLRGMTAQVAYLGGGGDPAAGATLLDADAVLLAADRGLRSGQRVLATEVETGTLGWVSKWLTGKRASDDEIRQHILSSLRGDTTFAWDQSDEVYDELRPKLGGEIHWVVCGHTHLRRSHQDTPNRVYFNSGTWMRLLNLAPATGAGQFPQVLRALDATSRDALDKLEWTAGGATRPLVLRQPTVVRLEQTATGADGWLAVATHADGRLMTDGTEPTEVAGSRRKVAR